MADKIESFKDLSVWRKAMDLVAETYKIADQLPKHELYALGDQLRRSAVSIPSNIAEGSKRHNTKEFYQFIGIARGSAAELETQILLVERLHGSIETSEALSMLDEVQKMLTRLTQALKSKQ